MSLITNYNFLSDTAFAPLGGSDMSEAIYLASWSISDGCWAAFPNNAFATVTPPIGRQSLVPRTNKSATMRKTSPAAEMPTPSQNEGYSVWVSVIMISKEHGSMLSNHTMP